MLRLSSSQLVRRSSRVLRSPASSSLRTPLLSRSPDLSPSLTLVHGRSWSVPLYGSQVGSFREFSSKSESDEKEKSPSSSSSVNVNEGAAMTNNKPNMMVKVLKSAYVSIRDSILHPKETWQWLKEGAHHYWMGSKLLWSEIKITWKILGRLLKGHEMTRRERRQLIRTSSDLVRLGPMIVIVVVPLLEFALPVLLKLFPNMLPSTFEDKFQKEEKLKKELQMRLAVAKFLQETLQEIADKKTANGAAATAGEGGGEGNKAKEILDFIDKARKGEHISNDKVISLAKLFRDDLTLPNIARPQLVSMCKYMGLQPFGTDDFLRFQLRNKFRAIKEDDRRILWEGIDSLNTLELREANRERGMRSEGITQYRLKNQLQEWLQLSTQKHIPILLLIMSRAFSLTESEEPEDILKSSMSSLDSDIVNEVVVASASAQEEQTPDMQRRKLESLKFQEEMIEEEIEGTKKKDPPPVSPPPVTNEISPANPNPNPSNREAGERGAMKELTHHELRYLSDLARGSSFFREKTELVALQAMIEALLERANQTPRPNPSSNPSSSPNPSPNSDSPKTLALDEVKLDKALVTVKPLLEKMMTTLERRITTSEKEVGDKLSLLDQDGDGQLSSHELKEAIMKLLKKNYSEKEAEALVNEMDANGDGQISLSELLVFIQKKKDLLDASVDPDEEKTPSTPIKP